MTLMASRTWALGRVLPLLVAMLLLGDALARFLPVDSLCFQAWECMTRFQEPGAIFEANRQFRSARTHGNLSNMGNLPLLRQYRPQLFNETAQLRLLKSFDLVRWAIDRCPTRIEEMAESARKLTQVMA